MKQWFVTAAVVLGICASGPASSAGDAAAGQTKSAACAACHGADGNSTNPMYPKLAGQAAAYLAKQLRDFRQGLRANPIMSPMAKPLSDQDIDDLAAYFSVQPVQMGSADEALLQAGQKLYRGGNTATGVSACMACHGPAGKGNAAARFPALASQHADYVAAQLAAFAAGDRTNDPGGMMRDIASRMSRQEMKAVAAGYISGLH